MAINWPARATPTVTDAESTRLLTAFEHLAVHRLDPLLMTAVQIVGEPEDRNDQSRQQLLTRS